MSEPHRPTLDEILASETEDASSEDPLAHYVEVTPRALAMLNLRDCKEQLERWKEEPLRLAQAAKSVHLAMQAALTDALARSAGIGAYSDELRAEYLAYFEDSRERETTPPKDDFVLPFPKLLARAMEHPMEWSGRKLEVSADQIESARSTDLRSPSSRAPASPIPLYRAAVYRPNAAGCGAPNTRTARCLLASL